MCMAKSDSYSMSEYVNRKKRLLIKEKEKHFLIWAKISNLPLKQQACLCNINVAVFKALALWADAFFKSKCPSVCPCVCPCVRLFTFEVPFKPLFAPTS